MYRHEERRVQSSTVRNHEGFVPPHYQPEFHCDYRQRESNHVSSGYNNNAPFLNTSRPWEREYHGMQPGNYPHRSQQAAYFGHPPPNSWQEHGAPVYYQDPRQYSEQPHGRSLQSAYAQPRQSQPQNESAPRGYQSSPFNLQSPPLPPQPALSPAPNPAVRNRRRPRNGTGRRANNADVTANDKKLLSRTVYDKGIGRIRNKFCASKSRQKNSAKIVAAEEKNVIYARIRGAMVGRTVERTNIAARPLNPVGEPGFLNDDVERIALLAGELQVANNRRDVNNTTEQNLREEISLFGELDRCYRRVDENLALKIRLIETTTDAMMNVEVDEYKEKHMIDPNDNTIEEESGNLSNEDSDWDEDS